MTELLVLDRFSCKCHLSAPLFCEIFPARVPRFDQRDLLRSGPAFQLFLAADCLVNVVEALVVHQPVAVVLARKPPRSHPACAPVHAGRRCSSSRCIACLSGCTRCTRSTRDLSLQHRNFCHPVRSRRTPVTLDLDSDALRSPHHEANCIARTPFYVHLTACR